MVIKLSTELVDKNILDLPDSIKSHLSFDRNLIEDFFENLEKNPTSEYLKILLDLKNRVFLSRIVEVSKLCPGKTMWVSIDNDCLQNFKLKLEKNDPQVFEIKCFSAIEKWDLVQAEKEDAAKEDQEYFADPIKISDSGENSSDEEEESAESFGNK